MQEFLSATLEIKSVGSEASGEFAGYASVAHILDHKGDKVLPGAFEATLAERRAQNRRIPMHLNHGIPELAGQRGIGVWPVIKEDEVGLAVEGKISGMNTDGGRLIYERIKDGAYPGISIGFKPRAGGAVYGKGPGEPRRTLKAIDLFEMSIVDDPANSYAKVLSVKSAANIEMLEEIAEIKAKLAGGELPTQRELERAMRDAFGFSRAQAEKLATSGFKALTRESEGRKGDLNPEVKSALSEAIESLRNLRLST